MFRESSEAQTVSYTAGYNDVIELAAGPTASKCLGIRSLSAGNISLTSSLHVDHLNGTLLSVGNICDQDKTVVLTKDEAVLLHLTKFKVRMEDIVAVVPRNKHRKLHELNKLSYPTALSAKP